MKLAISNIAWHIEQDPAVARIMRQFNAVGVEIAPTKIWPAPLSVSDAAIEDYRQFWEDHGIRIVAMQALLYGRPDLTIFDDESRRDATFRYLCGIIELGSKLGATALVFGSPGNRKTDGRAQADVERISLEFFSAVGKVADSYDLTFCIEPNPVEYGCDFITNSEQGLDLVRRVGVPGFGLHLDAAAMTLSRESIAQALGKAAPSIKHFHISEPNLAPIGDAGVDHAAVAAALRDAGYAGWVSIEMRAPDHDAALEQVQSALAIARDLYIQ